MARLSAPSGWHAEPPLTPWAATGGDVNTHTVGVGRLALVAAPAWGPTLTPVACA